MTSPNEPRQTHRKRRQELVAPGIPRRTFSVRALASASAGSTTPLRTQGDTMAAPAYIPLRARPVTASRQKSQMVGLALSLPTLVCLDKFKRQSS
jgi:hypothetical protein